MEKETGDKRPQVILQAKMKELSAKYGVPIEQVEEICKAPFGFFREMTSTLSHGAKSYPSFKIPWFITLYVSNQTLWAIEHNEGRKERIRKKYGKYEGEDDD